MIFMLLIFCNGSKQILQKDHCFDNINFEKEKYQNSSILFKNVLRLCEYISKSSYEMHTTYITWYKVTIYP